VFVLVGGDIVLVIVLVDAVDMEFVAAIVIVLAVIVADDGNHVMGFDVFDLHDEEQGEK